MNIIETREILKSMSENGNVSEKEKEALENAVKAIDELYYTKRALGGY